MAAKLKRKSPNKEQTLPIRLAYTIELPDDGREYGFLLPASKLPQVHICQKMITLPPQKLTKFKGGKLQFS